MIVYHEFIILIGNPVQIKQYLSSIYQYQNFMFSLTLVRTFISNGSVGVYSEPLLLRSLFHTIVVCATFTRISDMCHILVVQGL